ncbi:MAG: DUF6279 family lipoprotein [Sinimarinibacterium sp.]|jgi:hypothetical protein
MWLTQITAGVAARRKALRLIAVGALLAMAAGCSMARLAYEQLDRLVRWELGRYVSLTAEQRTVFDREFAVFWQWHRDEELPGWVDELRGLATQLEPGTSIDRARIEATSTHLSEIMRRLSGRFAPIACVVGPQLDAAQVEEVLDGVDEDIDELREEQVEIDPEDARKETRRSIEKGLRRWLGRLTGAQEQVIDAWAADRPSVAGAWLDYRLRWRAELESVLARRGDAAFCGRITTLMADGASLWTPAQKQAFADNRTRWLDLFAALIPTLTPEQRGHAQQRLRELAAEFEAASRAPP